MSRIGLNLLFPTLVLLLVVAAGYGAGVFLNRAECCWLVALACLTGVILAIAACCRPSVRVRERLLAVGLVGYIVAAVASDALLFVQDAPEVLESITWLIPLVVGGVMLPQRGALLTTIGCWAVFFGGVVALSYNISHVDSGVGFFVSWVS